MNSSKYGVTTVSKDGDIDWENMQWVKVEMPPCPYTTIKTRHVGTISFQGTDMEIMQMMQRTFGQDDLHMDWFGEKERT